MRSISPYLRTLSPHDVELGTQEAGRIQLGVLVVNSVGGGRPSNESYTIRSRPTTSQASERFAVEPPR